MPNNANDDGDLGEIMFKLEISRDALFRPSHLGEKWPASDFYVELKGIAETLFFVVQVKTTSLGMNNRGRLRISVPLKKLNRLRNYHAPTYVAGVDVTNGRVYMTPIHLIAQRGISSLSTAFELNAANRRILYDDVIAFWAGAGIINYKNNFNHAF